MTRSQAARLAGLATASLLLLAPAPSSHRCPTTQGALDHIWANRPAGCTTEAEAEKICKKWVGLCKKRVKSAIQCTTGAIKVHKTVLKTLCGTESEGDPKGCKQGVAGDKKHETNLIKGLKPGALDECDNHFQMCINEC